MLYTKRADFNSIAARFAISPVTARIIVNRDISEDKMDMYINGTQDDMYDPHLLKDCDKAVAIIKEKVADFKKIRIVGDYDIDGVCSTYIFMRSLKRIGALVDCIIPDRIKDGYGINESIIKAAIEDGIDTILTCDNGIAAVEAIKLAVDSGLTVIITDHHEVFKDKEGRDILPLAAAIINPKQSDCLYPFKGICGGFLAFKVSKVIYEAFDIPLIEWQDMLYMAAIATIGDVMKLKDENRIVVRYGLKQIEHMDNIGLKALIEVCGLDIAAISAYHIGFVIGPCLNAGGRLEHAKIALRLLLSENEDEASKLALHLKNLNDQRKDMTLEGIESAKKTIEEKYMSDKVLIVYLKDCHESIAGIIAGRIREAYGKPCIVLTTTESGLVKGSGRSIECYHMFNGLREVDDILIKYGGHPMAAGMTLLEKNVDEFRRRINEMSDLKASDFIENVWIDIALPLSYINESWINELSILEPFGQGNEKPVFGEKDIRVLGIKVFGRQHNVVKLSLRVSDGVVVDGLIFTDGYVFKDNMGASRVMDILYYPQINEYMGRKSIQIVIRDWRFK